MLKLAPKPRPTIRVKFLLILSMIFFVASSGPIGAQDDPANGLISSDEFPVRWVVVHHETVVVEDFVVSQMEPVLEPELVQDNKESIEPLENENLEDSDPLEEESADPFGDDSFEDDPFEEDPFAEEEVVIPIMTDPFHGFNRTVYGFNDNVYEYFMRPVAETYRGVVNEDIRTAIRNLFDNALIPTKLLSSLIQGKWEKAGRVLSRTVINTIFGLGGALDVAGQEYGIKDIDEDFAQALGFYGVPSGPYVVLPFLGPSSVRHTVGRGVDLVLDPTFFFSPRFWESAGMTGGKMINGTTFFIDDIKALKEGAIDPYESIRDFYHQRREILIHE